MDLNSLSILCVTMRKKCHATFVLNSFVLGGTYRVTPMCMRRAKVSAVYSVASVIKLLTL